jgi:hypothetical protein
MPEILNTESQLLVFPSVAKESITAVLDRCATLAKT